VTLRFTSDYILKK